jgi:lysyl-tRNA synthetase, class II
VNAQAERPTARPLRSSQRASRIPVVVAAIVAVLGCLGVLAATAGPLHGAASGLQKALVPEGAAQGVVRGLVAGTSLVLLLSARGLARRQHRAWTLATTLTCAAFVLFLLRDVDLPALFIAGALLAVLWYWRGEFYAAAATPRPAATAVIAAGALAAIWAYGVLAQIRLDGQAGAPGSWARAASDAAWSMVGQDVAALPSEKSRELVAALTVSTALVLAWLAWALLRPPRGRVSSTVADWREARRIVASAGSDSLAYFALRRDKVYYFDEQRSAFLAYRAVGGIALISGDPIGRPEAFPRLLADFARYCRSRAWRMAAIGVGEETRRLWESAGLKTVYVGDEAVVHPSGFSLEGRAVRKLRQSVRRLERLGYSVEVRRAGDLDATTLADVVWVSEIWKEGQPERGFSMALDDIRSSDLDDTLFVLGRDPDGRVAGLLHFVPVPASGDLSLSAMRRLPDTPNGFNEFLVCSLLFWARERGVGSVSLNFAVFGGVLRDEGAGAAKRISRGALRYSDRFFQVERLLDFNRKFGPEWAPRYLAVERLSDLPSVGLVVLHLESLLPGSRGPAASSEGPGSPEEAPGDSLHRVPSRTEGTID